MDRKAATALQAILCAFLLTAPGIGAAEAETGPTTAPDTAAEPRLSIADPDLVLGYIDGLRATRTALADYRWRTRTAIRVDDREWLVQLFDVRLDREGRLRSTLIGHEIEDTTVEGPIRRRIVLLDEQSPATAGLVLPGEEQAAALKRLAESYTHPAPADVRRVPLLPAPQMSLQPLASTVPDADDEAASAETSFRLYDMVHNGDSFEVWFDSQALEPLRLEAQTDLNSIPVEVAAEYSRLPDGTVYQARSTIRTVVENHAIEVRIESFGFRKRRRTN